jgi:hypothetical protein
MRILKYFLKQVFFVYEEFLNILEYRKMVAESIFSGLNKIQLCFNTLF